MDSTIASWQKIRVKIESDIKSEVGSKFEYDSRSVFSADSISEET